METPKTTKENQLEEEYMETLKTIEKLPNDEKFMTEILTQIRDIREVTSNIDDKQRSEEIFNALKNMDDGLLKGFLYPKFTGNYGAAESGEKLEELRKLADKSWEYKTSHRIKRGDIDIDFYKNSMTQRDLRENLSKIV
jgi:hypothetical protein